MINNRKLHAFVLLAIAIVFTPLAAGNGGLPGFIGPTNPSGPIATLLIPGVAAGLDPPVGFTGGNTTPGFGTWPPCYLRDGVMQCDTTPPAIPYAHYHRFNSYGYSAIVLPGDVDDSVSVRVPLAREMALSSATQFCENNPLTITSTHDNGTTTTVTYTYYFLETGNLWAAYHEHLGENAQGLEPFEDPVSSQNHGEYILYGLCARNS